MPDDALLLLALMAAAGLLWTTRASADLVVGLLLLWIVVLLDLAPPSVAFGGLASPVFLMLLGVFLLSALFVESPWLPRLTQRLTRWVGGHLKRGLSGFAAMAIGLCLVLPSPLGRSAILSPLLEPLGQHASPQQRTVLLFTAGQSLTLFSTVFLTGNPLNFVLIGLLDSQSQQRIQWLSWLQAAVVFALVAAVGLLCIVLWMLRGDGSQAAAKARQPETTHHAGTEHRTETSTSREVVVPLAYVALLAGVLTQSWHGLELYLVIGFVALWASLAAPPDAATLRHRIDWPTLVFVATLASWQLLLVHAGIDRWVVEHLPGTEAFGVLSGQPLGSQIVLMALAVGLLRLFVPGAPAFVILAAALMPVAARMGLSPWVMGFVLLSVSEGYLLRHQHGVPLQLRAEYERLGWVIDERLLRRGDLAAWTLRVAALVASLPWWQHLDLI